MQAVGDGGQGFVPRDFSPTVGLAHHRRRDALGLRLDDLEAAVYADHAGVGGFPVTIHPHQHVAARHRVDAATNRAGHAGGQGVRVIALAAHVRAAAVDQCAGRADLEAGAAGDAGGLAERHIVVGDNQRVCAALPDAQRVVCHELVAHADAAPAEDTAAVIHKEVFARRVHRPLLGRGRRKLPVGQAVLVGQPLQFALRALVVAAHSAVHAVVHPLREEEIEHKLPGLGDTRRGSVHNHAFRHRVGAGRLQIALLFDLHQAHPAAPERGHRRVVAQSRDEDAGVSGCLQHCLAGLGLELLSIDSEIYDRHRVTASF